VQFAHHVRDIVSTRFFNGGSEKSLLQARYNQTILNPAETMKNNSEAAQQKDIADGDL
jgi:hypothetical protein